MKCIHCKMITKIKLIPSPLHIVTFFFLMRTHKIYSFSNIQYSIINYSHHAVHYILQTYSSYNWKFVSFDQHLPISLTPAVPENNYPTLWFYEFNFFFNEIPHITDTIYNNNNILIIIIRLVGCICIHLFLCFLFCSIGLYTCFMQNHTVLIA